MSLSFWFLSDDDDDDELLVTSSDNDGKGAPVYTGEIDCTYFFVWDTKYACIKEKEGLPCGAIDGKKRYDLSALVRHSGSVPLPTWPVLCACGCFCKCRPDPWLLLRLPVAIVRRCVEMMRGSSSGFCRLRVLRTPLHVVLAHAAGLYSVAGVGECSDIPPAVACDGHIQHTCPMGGWDGRCCWTLSL